MTTQHALFDSQNIYKTYMMETCCFFVIHFKINHGCLFSLQKIIEYNLDSSLTLEMDKHFLTVVSHIVPTLQ